MNKLLYGASCGALALWFVLTVIAQYPDDNYAKLRKLKFVNGSFLIPNWKFFAPNPGIEDYILLYRVKMKDQERWQDWNYVIPPSKPRIWESFFSPISRHSKGILDIVTHLQSMSGLPYLQPQVDACRMMLQNIVKEQITIKSHGSELQMMIARGSGFDPEGHPNYDYVFEPVLFERDAA